MLVTFNWYADVVRKYFAKEHLSLGVEIVRPFDSLNSCVDLLEVVSRQS